MLYTWTNEISFIHHSFNMKYKTIIIFLNITICYCYYIIIITSIIIINTIFIVIILYYITLLFII